jgi:pyrroline-5-carboxylate reductase
MGKKIAFIGGGNMAEALIKGLIESGFAKSNEIIVSDIRKERLEWLSNEYKVETELDNLNLTKKGEILILAVKPQDIPSVLGEIKGNVRPHHLIVSIAAGISIAYIQRRLQEGIRIIRVMPNAPALVKQGCSAISPGRYANSDDLEMVKGIFGSVGEIVIVEEKWMDVVTALSGSGPAYFLLIIEALTEGGVKMGLPREISQALTLNTLIGTAILMKETKKHPAILKEMVTSPGGTTIAGLHEMEKGGIRGILMSAIDIATQRSRELGQLFV